MKVDPLIIWVQRAVWRSDDAEVVSRGECIILQCGGGISRREASRI